MHVDYSSQLVADNLQPRVHGNHYWLLDFDHSATERDTNLREFVQAFKQGNERALEQGIELLVWILREKEPHFRDVLGCRHIMAVPGHMLGPPSQAAEQACSVLAEEFSWLKWVKAGLQRHQQVPRSQGSRPPERPTVQEHLRTIAYTGPVLTNDNAAVLLFDDVLATGATTIACRQILETTAGTELVVGLYLARVHGPFEFHPST